jgi:predicted RNase H-like nuclease (RuvC/YqgF family)
MMVNGHTIDPIAKRTEAIAKALADAAPWVETDVDLSEDDTTVTVVSRGRATWQGHWDAGTAHAEITEAVALMVRLANAVPA